MLSIAVGKRELGKTTLAVSVARGYSTRVFYDPRHMINTTRNIVNERNLRENLYALLDTESEIVVRPEFDKEVTFEGMCEEIVLWLKDNPGEPFCLLLDESRFISEPEKNEHFDYIVRCLPSRQVNVIMTCHGVVDVSPDLRRVADFWLIFHLTMESDLERIRERCGDVVADEVSKLEPFQYVVWNDQKSTWAKHVEPRKWFVKLESEMVTK